MMSRPLLMGASEEISPYMNMNMNMNTTCFLCHKPFQDCCFTISPCLHSFCRKCIHQKLSAGIVKGCPLCDVNLGHVSVAEIRPDHYLQDMRASVYPLKKRKAVLEVCSSSKGEERSISCLVDTPRPIVYLPPATEVVKKRRLEEFLRGPITYHPHWSLTDERARLLLNMVSHLVQNAVQPEQSVELVRKPVPDVLQWLKYLANNENKKLEDKEAENLSNLCSECDVKLTKQAELYEAKLKEQAQRYEAKLKEHAQHYEAQLKSLVKVIPELQHESHRAGMEEGVKRTVRAVQASASYVKWDQIHISENTPEEDRESLQRAFFDGIISAPSPVTDTQDQTHVVFL